MVNKIHVLSAQVANQIAAGEVIERPASIVKELMENSLDAGSDEIILSIKNGGNSFISITDNGSGIVKEDLALAICQHATSKLSTLSDLETIRTLGFRGEALASICSAAKLKITSRSREASEHAWSLEVLGDPKEYQISPASHPIGTTIEVRDLFFNIPVRRRFLKAIKTEYQHILEIFQKIALSHFECAFTLISDDKIIYKLPKATNRAAKDNRVKKIFGLGFIKNASYFEGEAPSIALRGWIGNSDCHRSQADQQYFFLNNRVIRDKLIIHAIKFAHENFMPPGRHPCYVLYLDLDPNLVDVNVHPTKHEVRFCESRWVHQFVVAQVHNVLSNTGVTNYTDAKVDNFSSSMDEKGNNFLAHVSGKGDNFSAATATTRDRDDFLQVSMDLSSPNTMREVTPNRTVEQMRTVTQNRTAQYSAFTNHTQLDKADHPISKNINIKREVFGNILSHVNENYVLTSNAHSETFLVDLIAGYHALVLDKLLEEWQDKQQLTSYSVLIKPSLSLEDLWLQVQAKRSENGLPSITSKQFLHWLQTNLQMLTNFGLSCELWFNPDSVNQQQKNYLEFVAGNSGEVINSLKITAVPRACRYGDYKDILLVLLCGLITLNSPTEDELFKQLSSLSTSRINNNLLLAEQQAILDKLAKNQYNSHHNKLDCLAKKLTADDCSKILNPQIL